MRRSKIVDNPQLTTIVNVAYTVVNSVIVRNCPLLTTLAFPALTDAELLYVCRFIKILFAALESLDRAASFSIVTNNGALTTLTYPVLTISAGANPTFHITNNRLSGAVSIPNGALDCAVQTNCDTNCFTDLNRCDSASCSVCHAW